MNQTYQVKGKVNTGKVKTVIIEGMASRMEAMDYAAMFHSIDEIEYIKQGELIKGKFVENPKYESGFLDIIHQIVKPKDESKEVKEGGELFTGGEWEHDLHYGRSTARIYTGEGMGEYNICTLSGNAHTDEVKANALLIAQSKNMYYELRDCAALLNGIGGYDTVSDRIVEILKKANPNY